MPEPRAGNVTICKGSNQPPTRFMSGNKGRCSVCDFCGPLTGNAENPDVLDVHYEGEPDGA